MAFLTGRILAALWPREPRYGTLDSRAEPEPIVLPGDGSADPEKPPVRIYLGTELAQFRAERAFVWSIERVRDRSRRYEIHLMKELAGFDRRRWLTGFTNYRFAIPDFAGRNGRAIYNDEDQIYLSDPALMFDLEMGSHGYLSVSDNDTSVMLLDCAKMAPVWNLEAACSRHKNRLLASARAIRGLWGALAPEWNARDEEYAPGRSHLIHYTALHTQPWRPFLSMFAYQDSPEGAVWHELERSADAAGFQIFSREHPSRNFQRLLDWLAQSKTATACGDTALPWLDPELADRTSGRVLRVLMSEPAPGGSGTTLDLSAIAAGREPTQIFDSVVCRDMLEYLPDEDIPWFIEELFKRSGALLTLTVQATPRTLFLGSSRELRARAREPQFWIRIVENVARRHPGVGWKLVVHDPVNRRIDKVRLGGQLGRKPLVWVLDYHKPGHSIQSLGLAEALGWPYEVKQLRFRWPAYVHRGIARVLGLTEASDLGLAAAARTDLQGPFPDLVIATGWRPARVARWIARASRGRCRTVLLGRKGAPIADVDDILISCRHFKLPAHPRRLEVLVPPNRVTRSGLAAAVKRWETLFAAAPAPRIGLLVGGTTELHRLDAPAAAALGAAVRAFAEARGGSIFAVTSRRTGEAATRALKTALGPGAFLHEWRRDDPDNPYAGILAVPDILVVTGDSESMIAEAVATAKPVYIYRLQERPAGLRSRLAALIVKRAYARPLNRRGTVRPQQGLEYLCARLIERNIVQPPRDMSAMYEALIEAGRARYFDAGDSRPWPPAPELDTTRDTAERVRDMLGFTGS